MRCVLIVALLDAHAVFALTTHTGVRHLQAAPPPLRSALVRLNEPLERSSRLNKQAFNRRNMSIDERIAYDEIVREREAAAGSRNAAVAAIVLVAGAFLLADPTRLAGLLPGA